MNGRRRALLLLCTVVIGAVAVEMFARIRLRFKYGRFNSDFYTSRFDEKTGLMLADPSQDVGAVHINAHGLRGPEIRTPRGEHVVRVAFLGGSTTFCAEVDQDSMWPVRVCRLLGERHSGVEFEPIVAAYPGQFIEQSKKMLALKVAPLEPDFIVFYEATNDLSRDTRRLADAQGLFTGGGDERSWLARTSVAWDLIEKNWKARARARAAKAGTDRLKFDAEDLAKGFESALAGLVSDCRAVSPNLMLFTFSTRLRPEQSPAEQLESASSSLYYMPYMDLAGLLAGFAAYNRAIRRVAEATGTPLGEIAEKIPGDARHFHDSVHLTREGCAAMADLVIDALERNAAFRAVVARRGGAPGLDSK